MEHPIVLTPVSEEATLPRSMEYHEAQADRVWYGQGEMERALSQGLHDVLVTPRRYAMLMHTIETWIVEDHIATVDSFFPDATGDTTR